MFDNSGMVAELFEDQLLRPEIVDAFKTYHYEHVDLLDLMPAAADVLEGLPGASALLDKVREVLAGAGWEGDGTVRILWLPPFIEPAYEDGWGIPVWFVKQSNNGTAFLASPVELPYPNLLAQQR